MSADTAHATQATTAPADSGSGGLPQFDLAQWPGQMVWMLIIFGVLFALFAKVFVPKVSKAIDQREDRIAGDIGDARRIKDEADATAAAAAAEMAQARANVQKLVLEARAKARAEAAKREAAEEAKIAALMARSDEDLKAARDAAMTHVGGIARETAELIIGKLTGAGASAEELQSAIGQA
jgi:F-type H+-transporting ATPase subunit b